MLFLEVVQHTPVDPEFFIRREFQDLQKKYLYSFSEPTFMDQALMYLSLANRQIDVGDGNSTDGLISSFHLTLLEDDQKAFPVYDAAPLIRSSVLQKYPFIKEILNRLSGKITTDTMRRMNEDADKKGKIPYDIAKDFLIRENLIQSR